MSAPPSNPIWDPERYQRFRRERSQPFFDLLRRIPEGRVRFAADLGCGTGDLTRRLSREWPDARIYGVDRSAEMLERARAGGGLSGLGFVEADVASWRPPEALDRVVSNAALQWVPDHGPLLERIASWLAPGGVLAVQVPNNRDGCAHRILAELATEPFWRARLSSLSRPQVESPVFYLETLHRLGLEAELWETIYGHVLPGGHQDILAWLEGTTLRPALSALPEEEARVLRRELARRIESAFEVRSYGVFYPFRRLFFVACRP